MAVTRGLDKADALRLVGEHATRVDLGLSGDLSGGRATLDVAHRLRRGRLDLSAFATAYAGIARVGGTWTPNAGAVAGLRATF